MILYVLKQNKNSKSAAYGKFFAYPVIEETINLDDLAEHMSNHNTPYSKGAIKGMLTDMVGCIKELLLEGKNVKIADLAIFSLGIKNNGGAVSEDVFTVSKNIKGVKLRARATGELIAKSLNLEAQLKKASATTKTTGNGGTTGGGNNGGNDNQGGTGSITGGNSGSQSSVTVIRALSLGELEFSDLGKVIWKEIRTALICGAVLGVLCVGKVMLVDHLIMGTEGVDISVALTVGLTLAATVLCAKLVGCTLPMLAKKLGFDPAVMASPFITTIVDALSLLVYFGLATALLKL